MSFCRHCGHELAESHVFCPRCGTAVAERVGAAPAPVGFPPRSLAARYRIDAVLGEGASGIVYRAVSLSSGEAVAVKRLRSGSAGTAGLGAEVAALARIEHPNVVALVDYGQDDVGPWLATELVAGASLRQLLTRTGGLRPEQVIGLMEGALMGLRALHEAGLLHGDLKPENIVVAAADGTSTLADIGVPGTGSPGYQAPEVIAGHRGDARSDLYAMGVVLYEALAGRPPYEAERPEVLAAKHATDPVPVLRSVPEALSALVAATMAKDPDARPSSAAELLAELYDAAAQAYGLDWRTRAQLGALAAVIGAEGAIIAVAETAGGSPAVAGGASRPTGRRPTRRLSKRARLLRTVATHKVTTAAVSAVVVAAAVGGGVAVAQAVGRATPSTTSAAVVPTTVSTTTTTGPQPTFGSAATAQCEGCGQVRPTTISLEGDPTSDIYGVQWSSWGGAEAQGTGTAVYLTGNECSECGQLEKATVVAFNPGTCGGSYGYQDVEWYFPEYGETFDPDQPTYTAVDLC